MGEVEKSSKTEETNTGCQIKEKLEKVYKWLLDGILLSDKILANFSPLDFCSESRKSSRSQISAVD